MPRAVSVRIHRRPVRPEFLWVATISRRMMDEDRSGEIAATFERIRRPLRWPMENFRRKHVANRQFVGYRFSRVRRHSVAGFSFGFALRNDSLPGIIEAPEVVGYAFVEPANSALHRDLVERPDGAVHRLASLSRRMGCPFEFHADGAVAAVRHRSVRLVPNELFALVASDFLMLCYQPLRAAGFLERVTKATTGPG